MTSYCQGSKNSSRLDSKLCVMNQECTEDEYLGDRGKLDALKAVFRILVGQV